METVIASCTHYYILNTHEDSILDDFFTGVCKLCQDVREFPKVHENMGKTWKESNDYMKERDLNYSLSDIPRSWQI